MSAKAVFVLCEKYSPYPEEEDTKNIMSLLSISQYLCEKISNISEYQDKGWRKREQKVGFWSQQLNF